MFNHDPAHTGYSTSSVPANPVLIWTFPSPNITSIPSLYSFVASAPSIANGYLYISGANGGDFYCLNATTGTMKWRNHEVTIGVTPAISDGRVYAGASPYFIVAYNASTGVPIWRFNATNASGSGGSPIVSDGVVYTGGGTNALYALNATTGKQIWKGQGGAGPAVVDGFVYSATSTYVYNNTTMTGTATGYVFALNASNGQEIWRHTTNHYGESSPAFYDGKIYIGLGLSLCSFNASNGALMWNYTTGAPVPGSPAVANGVVYKGSWDNYTYAFDGSNGTLIWKSYVNGGVASSIAIGDGTGYLLGNDRYLYALNASTGDLIWKCLTISPSDLHAFETPVSASPAVAYGNVYIGTNEGNVLAFGNAPEPVSTSSPSSSPSVPEFPTWTVIPLILTTALVAATVVKKKKPK